MCVDLSTSDVGWGSCAYQMVKCWDWDGDPNEQARARFNDTGQRKIIEWINNYLFALNSKPKLTKLTTTTSN